RRSGALRAPAPDLDGAGRAPDRRAPGDPARDGPAGLRRRARLRRPPGREPAAARGRPRLRAHGPGLGGARAAARRALRGGRPARALRRPGGWIRAPRGVELHDSGPRGLAGPGDRGRRPAHAGHRPLLLPVDLLPGAERRPVRDRDAGAGLHGGRAAREARRAPVAAARLRAAARPPGAHPHAAAQPEGRAIAAVTTHARERARGDGAALTPAELAAWVAFLKAHNTITRELEGDLRERHGLTLSDFDVLVQLRDGGPRGLRPVELARRVLLTPSGITRLLQGLERAGLVARVESPGDRRGHAVALTDAGRAALRSASRTHLAGVAELFAAPLDPQDLVALGAILGRLTPGQPDG